MRLIGSRLLVNVVCYIALMFVIFANANIHAQSISPELKRKLAEVYDIEQAKLKDKANIRIQVNALPGGDPVFEKGQDDFIHIASLQKLFLSYAVLNILGPEYRFSTEFYTDYSVDQRGSKFNPTGGVVKFKNAPDDNLGNLYIRGYGDPTFLHRDIFDISRELISRGINGIQDIVVDDSLFIDPPPAAGDAPYQAGSSANCLEFNSYRVDVKGAASGEKPIMHLSRGILAKIENRARTFLKSGTSLDIIQNPDNSVLVGKSFGKNNINFDFFKINIEGRIGATDKLYTKYLAHPYPSAYFGASFKEIFEILGIAVKGAVKFNQVPKEAKLIYNHESKTINEILSDLNHYSSNFIAGQLLFAIGQDDRGLFDQKLGLKNMEAELRKITDFPLGGTFADGSGLSTANRASLKQITYLLKEVYEDPLLSHPFISSLSRFGVSGTLKNRNILKNVAPVWTSVYEEDKKRSESIWGKTGTVDGVSGVAGIAPGLGPMLYSFAIVIEGEIAKNEATIIEDRLVGLISGVSN